ncbi:MAG: tetratricopeptide repeat protein, partial [Caldilineales bacterium]|nr:tetratricopeptide repeat protein [Caldilineales bacterium]
LIAGRGDRVMFIVLGAVGGSLGVLIPVLVGASHYAGVGVALGFILGVLVYVTYAAFRGAAGISSFDHRHLLIIALLSTIVAHFVEIHFGIAIVSTRTTFFVLTAVLVAVGAGLLRLTETPQPDPAAIAPASAIKTAKTNVTKGQPTGKRRPTAVAPAAARVASAPPLWRRILPFAVLVALVLFVLDWDFVSNQLGKEGVLSVFWTSWNTHLRDGVTVSGAGVLWIVLFTLIVALMLALGETTSGGSRAAEIILAAVVFSGLGLSVWLIYGFFQAERLLPLPVSWPLESKARFVANHITYFYLFLALLGSALAGVIFWLDPRPAQKWSRRNLAAGAVGAGLALVALYMIITVNLNLVRADVFFKLGQSTDARKEWRSSLTFYDLATAMMPREDYYQLFQGRALLESARAATSAAEQDSLLDRAETVLLRARDLNPLNTDHTANLARYYGTRALTTNDPAQRTQNFQQAADYYRQATTLSPNTAHLQNEWGAIYAQLGEYDKANERFQRSLELDSGFVDTYLRMAQMESQRENWEAALADYDQGAKLNPRDVRSLSGRAYALAKLGRLSEAIAANLDVLALTPTDIPTLQNVALLYQQLGQYQQALEFARQALSVAPAEQKAAIEDLVQQIQQQVQGAGGE